MGAGFSLRTDFNRSSFPSRDHSERFFFILNVECIGADPPPAAAGRTMICILRAITNPLHHLVPRNFAGAVAIQLIQTRVKLFALRGRQRKGVRRPGEVFPDLVHER